MSSKVDGGQVIEAEGGPIHTTVESKWTEERLRGLQPTEHDFQEFKGSGWLAGEIKSPRSDFIVDLSKQIGAFANAAGGRLFVGLDDEGIPDGGVSTSIKNGTREWLEDVIPSSVSPPLAEFNVYEVTSDGLPDSNIDPGHAVYVLEIPTGPDAPYQSQDYRYYLRIAGKSRPMGHRHVLDVLHRSEHPEVQISRIDPFGPPRCSDRGNRGPSARFRFRAHVENRGRILAQHVGAELVLPRWAVTRETRKLMSQPKNTRITQRPGEFVFFYYHPIPLFPTQEVLFCDLFVVVHPTNCEHFLREVPVGWRTYADNAPVREGTFDIGRFSIVQREAGRISRWKAD